MRPKNTPGCKKTNAHRHLVLPLALMLALAVPTVAAEPLSMDGQAEADAAAQASTEHVDAKANADAKADAKADAGELDTDVRSHATTDVASEATGTVGSTVSGTVGTVTDVAGSVDSSVDVGADMELPELPCPELEAGATVDSATGIVTGPLELDLQTASEAELESACEELELIDGASVEANAEAEAEAGNDGFFAKVKSAFTGFLSLF